jgi:hypothetical protein
LLLAALKRKYQPNAPEGDINVNPALPISVTFRKGKTVPRRGPYTVALAAATAMADVPAAQVLLLCGDDAPLSRRHAKAEPLPAAADVLMG